ncbi:uncharacterized protein LOC6587687 [Drosophila persimilis]|nr:uncharacterized protein LOC6587687 [Drosophila persimilis]
MLMGILPKDPDNTFHRMAAHPLAVVRHAAQVHPWDVGGGADQTRVEKNCVRLASQVVLEALVLEVLVPLAVEHVVLQMSQMMTGLLPLDLMVDMALARTESVTVILSVFVAVNLALVLMVAAVDTAAVQLMLLAKALTADMAPVLALAVLLAKATTMVEAVAQAQAQALEADMVKLRASDKAQIPKENKQHYLEAACPWP